MGTDTGTDDLYQEFYKYVQKEDIAHAVVLLSGGIDSTTCYTLARDALGTGCVTALSVSYGQNHETRELAAATKVINWFGEYGAYAHHEHIRLPMGVGGLTDEELEIPDKSYAELPQGPSPTYVPFRNGVLLAVAASYADSIAKKIHPQAKFVVMYGAHMDDAANYAYPDCTGPFISAMRSAIAIGSYARGMLYAPFEGVDKAAVVRMGYLLDAPLYLTWSCYRGGVNHCGTCPTCISRKDAFKDAGISDPTNYEA